jgi:hypothetical protein
MIEKCFFVKECGMIDGSEESIKRLKNKRLLDTERIVSRLMLLDYKNNIHIHTELCGIARDTCKPGVIFALINSNDIEIWKAITNNITLKFDDVYRLMDKKEEHIKLLWYKWPYIPQV